MNAVKFVCCVILLAVVAVVGVGLCDIARGNDENEEREKDEWDKYFGH